MHLKGKLWGHFQLMMECCKVHITLIALFHCSGIGSPPVALHCLCLQEVAQLEAETQQIFQENQQLNKQSNALNQDVST